MKKSTRRHASAKPARPRSGARRRRRGQGTGSPTDELASHPTSRKAQAATRAWLLKQHGPVCAYCGMKFSARVMTLDHVAPRRGQIAYDRRDNLVLACRGCNAAKRDLAPLAFLLGAKGRAMNLLAFGEHLSAGLIDLARSLVRPEPPAPAAAPPDRVKWGDPIGPDEDSPYRD